MIRDLETMERIQRQKSKEMSREQLQPLNPEGQEMARHKRFTFDIIDIPTDPLR
ncbi:MAG: hypothetical protein IKI35_05740 [Stomatobaculum sp.]|nr:hypothetical protein [Stomatobaculum sp.]MBR7058211.1 hypothetical protein [Stomatobaculum sp.]